MSNSLDIDPDVQISNFKVASGAVENGAYFYSKGEGFPGNQCRHVLKGESAYKEDNLPTQKTGHALIQKVLSVGVHVFWCAFFFFFFLFS